MANNEVAVPNDDEDELLAVLESEDLTQREVQEIQRDQREPDAPDADDPGVN